MHSQVYSYNGIMATISYKQSCITNLPYSSSLNVHPKDSATTSYTKIRNAPSSVYINSYKTKLLFS